MDCEGADCFRKAVAFVPTPFGYRHLCVSWPEVTRTDRNHGLQRLRRTAATYAELACPGAASRLLGHRDPRMAARHYVDPRIAGQRNYLPPRLQ